MNAPDIDKFLPHRLLLSRRDLHLNQDELAKLSGVSRGHISNIERGHVSNVGIEAIVALAKALNVSVLYLLGLSDYALAGIRDDEEEDLPPPRRSAPDPLAEELLTVYQQLPNDKRSILLNMAKVLRAADEPRIIGSA